MKILALVSSYRKNGHTSKVVSLLGEHLEEIALKNKDSLQFEKLFLGDYEINHCIGCRTCMNQEEDKCPLKDDVPLLKSKIKEADATIFASPVYVGDVSSSMKALIDRLAYICHRQEFYDKCAVIMATTNATSLRRTMHTIAAALYSWGFYTVGSKGFRTKSENDSKEILHDRYHEDISKLAIKLYNSVKDQKYLNPSSLSLAAFKLQQKYRANPANINTFDYEYWNDHGWTDPKRTYYFKHDAGSLKIIASKLLFKMLDMIFHD